MIGGGGSQLDTLVDTCTDQRFRFLGEIPPTLTHEFLAQIDIFLYDTEWHVESFCYVILEALAAGCVVVASSRGAIVELVQSGANGFSSMLRKTRWHSATVCCETLTNVRQYLRRQPQLRIAFPQN